MSIKIYVYPLKLGSWNFLCVISRGNLHPWPILNLIASVEEKLVFLFILLGACHRPHCPHAPSTCDVPGFSSSGSDTEAEVSASSTMHPANSPTMLQDAGDDLDLDPSILICNDQIIYFFPHASILHHFWEKMLILRHIFFHTIWDPFDLKPL